MSKKSLAAQEAATYPYDMLAWQGETKLTRTRVALHRSLLTGIPDTRPTLRRFCEGRGLTPPVVPHHLRPDRVRWVIPFEGGEPIIVEFRSAAPVGEDA